MTNYIPQNVLDEIRSRADIVGIIAEYIPLKKAGRNFKALCPFHSEKTSSFMVSPTKQIYHCFGCGEGGNIFNFVMKYEHVGFTEAARKIAQKIGVNIPVDFKLDKRKQSLFDQMYKINEMALVFYNSYLTKSIEGKKARDYLKNRDFTPVTISKFKLGYAPKKWNALYDYLKQKGFSVDLIEKASLISSKRSGGFCDRFRDRLIFPIFNSYDKVIGFGARILEEGKMPKYLNSSETAVFNKGKNLYGLNLAKRHIINKDLVVMVEGYTDCIRCHENGIEQTVASLGTALTIEQIRTLKRYTKNITLIFDSDKAGELASLRSLDLLIEEDITPKIIALPQKYDPDKYIRDFGTAEFEKLIENALNLFEYKINLLCSKYDAKKPEGKVQITAEFLPTLSRINNAILKSSYIKKLAERLSVNEQDILRELKKHKVYDYSYEDSINRGIPAKDEFTIDMAEKILLIIMLENNDLIKEVKARLRPDDISNMNARKIIEEIFNLQQKNEKINAPKLIDRLRDERIAQLISSISIDVPEIKNVQKNMIDCIKTIKERKIKKKLKNLQMELKNAQQEKAKSRILELTTECNRLLNQRKKLVASIK